MSLLRYLSAAPLGGALLHVAGSFSEGHAVGGFLFHADADELLILAAGPLSLHNATELYARRRGAVRDLGQNLIDLRILQRREQVLQVFTQAGFTFRGHRKTL